jgi:hypothetical protein
MALAIGTSEKEFIQFCLYYSNDESFGIYSCHCERCTNKILSSDVLIPYKERGLNIYHGCKITKQLMFEAYDIVHEYLQPLKRVASLESLSGHVSTLIGCGRAEYRYHVRFDKFLEGIDIQKGVDRLPLPSVLKRRCSSLEFTKDVMNHSCRLDSTFKDYDTKSFPAILWEHIGRYLCIRK